MLASREKLRRSLYVVFDLLVYDMVSDHVKTVASVTSSHGFDAEESVAVISGNGRYIVYSSDATDPDPKKAHHNINKSYRAENPFRPGDELEKQLQITRCEESFWLCEGQQSLDLIAT